MKKAKKLLIAMCCLAIGCSAFVGCGENSGAPDGATEITFWYDSGIQTQPVYRELIKKYNDTQGKTDGVYVVGSRKSGISTSGRTEITGGDTPNVTMISDKVFKEYARDSLFLDLSEYYATTPGSYSEASIPSNTTDRFKITVGANGEKTRVGNGEKLLGLPFGSIPSVLFYNKDHFNKQGIHIISVPEEELDAYNKSHGTNFAPHGYAEYKAGYLTGDAANYTTSKNIAGNDVVKVFNNAIPTNWEEFRNLSKYFTQEYNRSSSTKYGYVNENWFSHGWSVGGDCVGYDGEKYNFTLADDQANYLATTDVTVNGRAYTAGQTIRYEDKVNDNNIASYVENGSLYELPSQKDALMEFLCLTGKTDKVVDGDQKGYGVANPDTSSRGEDFTKGDVTMIAESFSYCIIFNKALGNSVDMAVMYQYREYEDGSVYETNGNEYLKVIGETYGETVYSGKLKTQNGTKIVGNLTSSDEVKALVIPTNSESSKYEAAWKFISWAASTEGQKIIAKTGNVVPNQDALALGNDFYSLNTSVNYYAPAKMSRTSDVGDWGYFEDGKWVTDWANDFNGKLRQGTQTISEFLSLHKADAQNACERTSIVIKGWR